MERGKMLLEKTISEWNRIGEGGNCLEIYSMDVVVVLASTPRAGPQT
jgi:hypothetical protein